MLNLTYTSSNGTTFDLLTFEGLKLKDANFHSYRWNPLTTQRDFGAIVNGFAKEPKEYELVFYFRGSLASRKQKIEEFHFCTEYDVEHQTPGKITWGDDYILGYFVGMSTQPVENGNGYTENVATFYNYYPAWIEEKQITINSQEMVPGDSEINKGYPTERTIPFSYPYEYSYSYGENSTYVDIDHYSSSNFKLIAYGPASNISINIASHNYAVNYPLLAGEYMVIDSRPSTKADRRCYVVKSNGTIVNTFDYRNPFSSIFEPIPPGNFIINYPRAYAIELTVFIERSEPRCQNLYS